MKNIITEVKRTELVAKSKTAQRERDGKTRYQKRLKSKVSKSVKEYNKIDMNKLFKEDILIVTIRVQGETDNYLIKISYGGVIREIQQELKRLDTEEIDLRVVIRALIKAFNANDVYVNCSCPDFYYRFGYWTTVDKTNSGEPQLIPSKETNPNNSLGPACKHVLLVLSNTSWVIKVASVITNYINYMKEHKERLYADIIYKSIYRKKYEKPVQIDIENDDDFKSDEEEIDTSNKFAKTKSQFKTGNDYRFRKQDKDLDNQTEMEFDEEEVDDRQ